MIKMLVIDDDLELTDLLAEFCSSLQIKMSSRRSPTLGLSDIRSDPPDMVIIDIMLPEMNGYELCKRIRLFSKIPIIMLTARGGVSDRIMGLELGADDYLSKPFNPHELITRVQTVLRRSDYRGLDRPRQTTRPILTRGGLKIDLTQRTAILGTRDLLLTSAEFDALAFLCSKAGTPVSRDAISTCLTGKDWNGSSRGFDILLSRLRQKLGDDTQNPRFIKTLRSKGYQFLDCLVGEDQELKTEPSGEEK